MPLHSDWISILPLRRNKLPASHAGLSLGPPASSPAQIKVDIVGLNVVDYGGNRVCPDSIAGEDAGAPGSKGNLIECAFEGISSRIKVLRKFLTNEGTAYVYA